MAPITLSHKTHLNVSYSQGTYGEWDSRKYSPTLLPTTMRKCRIEWWWLIIDDETDNTEDYGDDDDDNDWWELMIDNLEQIGN